MTRASDIDPLYEPKLHILMSNRHTSAKLHQQAWVIFVNCLYCTWCCFACSAITHKNSSQLRSFNLSICKPCVYYYLFFQFKIQVTWIWWFEGILPIIVNVDSCSDLATGAVGPGTRHTPAKQYQTSRRRKWKCCCLLPGAAYGLTHRPGPGKLILLLFYPHTHKIH